MERKKIIAGNWKMHKTAHEAREYLAAFQKGLNKNHSMLQAALAIPFISLAECRKEAPPSLWIGAQNLHFEKQGAFTGEISAEMLHDLGVNFVLIGHSERRHIFKEDLEVVAKKLHAALQNSLIAFLCVGETEKEREEGKTKKVLEEQLQTALQHLSHQHLEKLVIAYEPVWAIGTGKSATAEQAQEEHRYIRNLLKEMADEKVAQRCSILYGGSVKPTTIAELMRQPDIDGALVGGASLDPNTFLEIIHNAKGEL